MTASPAAETPAISAAEAIDNAAWFDSRPARRFRGRVGAGGNVWIIRCRGAVFPREPEVPVKVREWIAPGLTSPDVVLDSEPPAQPHSRVVVERAICFAGGADTEVIGPPAKRAVQHVDDVVATSPLPVADTDAALSPLWFESAYPDLLPAKARERARKAKGGRR